MPSLLGIMGVRGGEGEDFVDKAKEKRIACLPCVKYILVESNISSKMELTRIEIIDSITLFICMPKCICIGPKTELLVGFW